MAKEMIFIIEDERNIAELIKFNLEKEGFRVQHSAKGLTGLELARKLKPDLIILDLMLPEIDGLEICKVLKKNDSTAHIPIIMLTAKAQETDKIIGLELGADDYITKPFSPRELIARVKTILRRVQEKPKSDIVRAGTIEINHGKHVVTLKGKPVDLTSKEYDLLKTLLEAGGRVLAREVLLDRVWGYDKSLNIETRTVDMHIRQLRKKLKAEAEKIVTVKNVGYRFDSESSP